jgi:hypothetical protein
MAEVYPSPLFLDPPTPGLVAIYGLYDPLSGLLRYIGKAQDPRHRYARHCTPRRMADDTSHRAHWLRSLLGGGLVPRMVVLDWVEATEWQAAECYYIEHARRLGCSLVNLAPGGRAGATRKGQRSSPEHCARISRALRGIKRTDAARERDRQAQLARFKDNAPARAHLADVARAALRDPARRAAFVSAGLAALRQLDKDAIARRNKAISDSHKRNGIKPSVAAIQASVTARTSLPAAWWEARNANIRATMATPEYQEKRSALSKDIASRPGMQEQLSAAGKKAWATPEQRQAQSDKAKRQWEDPAFREAVIAAIRARTQTPEGRAKLAQQARDAAARRKQANASQE